MEMTLKTMVIAILAFFLLLIAAALILGWGEESNNIFHYALQPIQDMIIGG